MKRRNADCGKLRRPLKRGKIPDSFYGSLFMYMKFVMVWLLVLLADFILEFRFEYLWPFWLLVRSVYDSFKYQGLAFSVFFVCIALTSDMICFLFIPVHWLFFAASTYVWVQFVWHTERGICLPTVSLWLLFVYIEASIRLRELKNLPFHLDLCRPFASHCIGYPVVTLGFGFKSYVGYRMRQRKQKEVAKENEFYMQLIKQALPQEQQQQQQCAVVTTDKVTKGGDEVISNGVSTTTSTSISSSTSLSLSNSSSSSANKRLPPPPPMRDVTKFAELDPREAKKQQILGTSGNSSLEKELEYMENELSRDKRSSVNDYDESADVDKDKSYKSNGVAPPHCATSSTTTTTTTAPTTTMATRSSPPSRVVAQQHASHHHHQHQQHHHHQQQHHIKENKENVIALNSQQQPQQQQQQQSQSSQRRGGSKNNAAIKDGNVNNFTNQKDDHTLRLEADIKRLKADLQASRQCELDLRSQLNTLSTGERSVKNELQQFQQDNENLQAKLHGLVTARQHDKQSISSLEKKLQEERRFRSSAETQLNHERKLKKVEAEAASRAAAAVVVANNVNSRQECTENCKARKRELDNDNKQLRRELKMCEERVRQAEREVQGLRQYKESHNEAEVLMSALSAMQDKNSHLENSLSAETRLKLDLFSALGDAKRQLEISQALLGQKCKEIDELKSRIAEVMAVMPSTTPFPPVSLDTSSMHHRSTSNASNHVHHAHFHHHHHHASSKFVTDDTSGSVASNLDPNASVYTPKNVGGMSSIDEI